jgi:hypothetical protein
MPIEYDISFDEMKWTAFGVNSFTQMSFSTILQHQTERAAVSDKLSIETEAASIVFLDDPPRKVTVNTIFQVSLKVSITGGGPLPNAAVSCNVTKAVSFTNIAVEIFSSLANSNYNIQRSSFLAPGSRLDNNRANTIADRDGIAKLYIRIKESSLDSDVRIVCQSGKAQTSPSTKIRVDHVIKKITQDKSISETIGKDFKRSGDNYLGNQLNLIFRN